jgi:Tfp pilus assembly protein PilV
MNRINNQQGQLLIEVLIAVVVGAVFLVGATAALLSVIRTNFENRGNQVAGTLAYEQLNKVVASADSDWHSVYDLSKGQTN